MYRLASNMDTQAVLLPPLAVAIHRGVSFELVINLVLWLLFWFPGVIHALYVIFALPSNRVRPADIENYGQYQQRYIRLLTGQVVINVLGGQRTLAPKVMPPVSRQARFHTIPRTRPTLPHIDSFTFDIY
jgi:uncharacterized membrane protein YqaE (UPF0057 family)